MSTISFYHVTNLLNVIRGSFKHTNLLRHHQAKKLEQLFESDEFHTIQRLHQKHELQDQVILVGITSQNIR